MPTESQVLERLSTIYDPELGLSLVDLGLIYGVHCEDGRVDVRMTLTTQGCPMHESLLPAVEAALRDLPGVRDVHVDLVWEPPWTPDRVSPAAAALLGL